MSLVFNQKITLDLTISRVQNVHCSQDDADSRNILIALSDNGKPYSIPSEVRILLKISKPDNTYVYIDVTMLIICLGMMMVQYPLYCQNKQHVYQVFVKQNYSS